MITTVLLLVGHLVLSVLVGVGFSWVGNTAVGHLNNVTTTDECCAACQEQNACYSFTLHPDNGCWLHGYGGSKKECGDGDECITGIMTSRLPNSLARPSEAHLRFHEDNLGAICHFGMQTFVSKNDRVCPNVWSPSAYFPKQLDTDQWIHAAASFGAKYFVMVVDHFSGFSQYPTTAHNYSVASSAWMNGTGDVVANVVASCKKYNIRPAFFYSVHENWHEGVCNFNLTDPVKQHEFEEMAMTQLQELGEKFGDDLAEIWFDAGVKQSDAFVSRVNEFISTKLPSTATCHSCQNMPNVSAVSWMGNEATVMPYPVWNTNDIGCSKDGMGTPFGVPYGTRWCPAHCDAVLRRHFWFWNDDSYDDPSNLNTPQMLLSMHMTSIGRGCNMILDMSPTTTGLLQQNDVDTYSEFGMGISQLYGNAVSESVGMPGQNSLEVDLPLSISRGAIELRENLTMGQAITNYTIFARAQSDADWAPLMVRNGQQLTIGNRRIHFWDDSMVKSLRVDVSTLLLQNGFAIPSVRSIRVFDWNNSTLDGVLSEILKLP